MPVLLPHNEDGDRGSHGGSDDKPEQNLSVLHAHFTCTLHGLKHSRDN
jgi:hypothetical protein